MNFGIYAGSVAGTDTGLATGKQDNAVLISKSLDELQGNRQTFLVRGYIQYSGKGKLGAEAPKNVEQYLTKNRKLNLVLCYRSDRFDEKDWTNITKQVIRRYQDNLYSIQITEEPNLKTVFAGDGSFEHIEKALLAGTLAAKEEINDLKPF